MLDLRRRRSEPDQPVAFVCNICGASFACPSTMLHREEPSCPQCRSNVRFRSLIAALSLSFFGDSLIMDNFPSRPDIVGLGVSDWEGYGIRLRRTFSYDNTYYDEGIRLDLTKPIPQAFASACDFVISSDVLEHVAPPYQVALENLRRLLKPGGLLVLTVPLKPDGETEEHFPDLHEFEITTLGESPVLINRTRTGELQIFEDLVFHGGPGVTLEMRRFSLPDLLQSLGDVGFRDVRIFDKTLLQHGILWNEPCTWPILARAPAD